MGVKEKIVSLTERLYPKGRVFNLKNGSRIKRLHYSLAKSEKEAYNASLSVLDSILPDNANFTVEDATRWEERLGMLVNNGATLADRKLAIARKMNHPGTIPARQSADYLQGQLRDAGFDVYVYRYSGLTIEQILYNNNEIAQLNDGQLGDFQLGDIYSYYGSFFTCSQLNDFSLGNTQLGTCFFNNNVINYITESKDSGFYVIGSPWVFFIGGEPLGEFADVDENRKEEFRQLILKLKPVNSIAQLLINYV